jgi:hypothetical protein
MRKEVLRFLIVLLSSTSHVLSLYTISPVRQELYFPKQEPLTPTIINPAKDKSKERLKKYVDDQTQSDISNPVWGGGILSSAIIGQKVLLIKANGK